MPAIVTGHRTPVVTITVTAVFTALVFLSTYLFQVPIPATQGYFNLGDIMIFISALTFGPIVGGFAGGVGSFLSDALGGFGTFAPFTLIIKGLEGLVAGLISRRSVQRRILMVGWAAGSVVMVLGYFIAESFFISLFFGSSSATGIVAASGEVPFNILQVVGGGAVGIPVSIGLKLAFRSTPCFSRMMGPVGGRHSEKN
ncbi:MAG TPA: ECF transporter S component [Candidatus Angelobacter sp.]|nr:ECF transporter S component [Candidatus Angelobacter sp.]